MGLYAPSTIIGTSLADNAAAGNIGELLSGTLATAGSLTLASGVAHTLITLALTPGDWDVEGTVDYNPAATTSITILAQGVSTTTAALDGQDTFSQLAMAADVPGANVIALPTQTRRLSLAATTNVYLVAKATFTVAALTAFGSIRARRMR